MMEVTMLIEFSTLSYDLDCGVTCWHCTTKHPQGNQVKVSLWRFKPMMKDHQAHFEFSTLSYAWIALKHLDIVQLSILKGIK